MSQIDDFLNDSPAQGSKSQSDIDSFLSDAPKPGPGIVGRAKDLGLSVAKGVVGVPEAAVGLADIATGGRAGKFLENEGGSVGFRPKQAKEYLSSLQSDAFKAEQQEFADADGILAKTGVALTNPALIANTVAESVPLMLGGGAIARGAGKAIPALAGRVGTTAAGEGAVMAGSQAEQIRQQTEDGLLTPTQSALAAGTGVVGAGLGVAGAQLARRLGVGDVDQMIASGLAKGSARPGLGVANRAGRGALAEGAFEELPQSLAETGLQNLALDRPFTEGMQDAAVLGTLTGGAMGAGGGVISGLGQRPPVASPSADPEIETFLGAGNPDAVRPEAPQIEAPDLTTELGAAGPRTGVDFTRDVDTSGLSLVDQARAERERAQTIDFQRQDLTPEWSTSQGAGTQRDGLTMPPPEFDTSGLSLTPSQQMGIDPSAGALSKVAAMAVDTGITQSLQTQAALANIQTTGEANATTAQAIDSMAQTPTGQEAGRGGAAGGGQSGQDVRRSAERVAQPRTNSGLSLTDRPDGTLMVTGDFNAIRAQLTAAGIPAQSIIRNARGATVGRTQAQAARQALSNQQEPANVSPAATVQRPTEPGAGLAPANAELATGSNGSGRAMAPAAVDVPELTTNVQNPPQGTAGAEAQAAPVEARAPEGGDAAASGGVPAAPAGAGVRADGVTSAPQILTGKSALFDGFGASVGSVSEGTRRQLMVDPDGGYFWGDWRQEARRDVGAVAGGADKDAIPASFATGKEAREAAAATPAAKTGSGGAQADGLSARLGRNNIPLSEGGKPFKTEKAARTALKQQTGMRVVKADGGFVLAPQTPAQIAARKKAAQRLGGDGNAGVPMAAHELLASRGGLSKDAMSDLGFDRNQRVGAKWLFAANGGMSLERATEALQQAGYMQGTDQGEAIAMIQRSARGNPVYTPEGYEQMAQAEAETRFEDHLAAQQEGDQNGDDFDPFAPSELYTDADLEAVGYEAASDQIKAQVRALLDQAEAQGIDTETIMEDAARATADQTEQAYYEQAIRNLTEAIEQSTASRSDQSVRGNEQGPEGAAQQRGRDDRRQDAGTEGAARGLTAQGQAAEEDYLKTLFGVDAQAIDADPFAVLQASTARDSESQGKAVQRIRDAIKAEASRAKASYEDWASRVYKRNKAQVDLRGDGPSNQASMSVGAINESRRRNAMEALSQELSEIEKVERSVATDEGAERVLSNLRNIMAAAERSVAAGNGIFKDADSAFEYMLLDTLKFRGPSGKGNVTSNGLSKAMLSAIKPPSFITSPTRADVEAQQARTDQAGELDQREQVRRESEVGDASFMSGFDGDGRQDTTGALFSAAERKEALADVRKAWSEAGIKNAISEKDGVITLSQVVVPEVARGEGVGTAAMQQLVQYADRSGQRIVLSPSADFGGNKNRLTSFYKRFGFVENKGRNRDFTTMESMYRDPQSESLRMADPTQRATPSATEQQNRTEQHNAPTDSHARLTKAFADRLNTQRDRPVAMEAVSPGTGKQGKTARSLAAISKKLFNRDVIFVRFTNGDPLFNGAVSRNAPGKIFINIDSQRPMMAVLGHELLHEFRKNDEAAYKALTGRLDALLSKNSHPIYADILRSKYEKAGMKNLPADIKEELYADIVGDHFTEPAFWEALTEASKTNPTLWNRVLDTIQKWLDGIANKMGRMRQTDDGDVMLSVARQADGKRPFNTNIFLNDVDASRQAVLEAFKTFGQPGRGVESDSTLSIADRTPQTETAAFKRWFGDSKVVDANGDPKVVYHGTNDNFNKVNFKKGAQGLFWFASDRAAVESGDAGAQGTKNIMDLYVKIENPAGWKEYDKYGIDQLERMGYDGVILPESDGSFTGFIFKEASQVKSATKNRGTFDPTNPDIRFSIADTAATMAGRGIDRVRQAANTASGRNVPSAAAMGDIDATQKALLSKIGSSKAPAADAIKAATDRAGLKIRQGVIDRYAALKELDEKALGQDFIGNAITDSSWVLAKMSSAGSGALNAMMTTGRIDFDDKQKVISIKGEPNGGLTATLQKLGGPAEVERFFGWIAANRAEKLMGEGRENLFTADEIAAGKRLNTGQTEEGKSRAMLYTQAFKEFQQYRDDVLAIAEKSGIISDETRALWRDEFYVPFYRVMQDDGKTGGPGGGKGLSRQEAFKKLKGGRENVNDLMENTLMNFHHLLSASLKNQAASQAIKNAEKVGIARKVPESRRDTDTSTFVLENGQKAYYEIDDPLVYESITSLSDPGLNNFAVRAMSAFKRVFTNLTTITPQFVIANTFRDLLQASATSPTSKNIALNTVQGLKTYRDQKTRAEMLASGGAFSFGHIYGMDPDEVKASLRKTVKGAELISDPSMIPGVLRKGWKHWNDAIDTSENISRAATYAQNVEGLGKLRAAFEARDVMDFSQHGAWPAVRFLVRVVPFLNARLQGLDKLYRSGVKPAYLTAMGKGTDTDKQAAARFATVTGALTLATMALYMANADDEEYQKLEEWQKDSYWFFRIGDQAFFLPKPFEVGAIATLAERTLQQMMDDKATGKMFGERVKDMLMQTFAFNPVPQMFQPAVDIYSNKDAFTGRDIETTGMERLSPGLRARDTTTAPARALSAASRVFGDESPIALSPVQADHLIKGYLGGVGASSAGILDTMYRTATGQESPDKKLSEYQPIRRFYRDLSAPAPNSRYTTLFYDGLREANRVYADVMELQKLGKTEEAQALRTEKQSTLRMRQQLNAQQRRLSDINKRLQTVRRSDNDGEWKRREIDLLNTQKALITERMGKMIEIVRAE